MTDFRYLAQLSFYLSNIIDLFLANRFHYIITQNLFFLKKMKI